MAGDDRFFRYGPPAHRLEEEALEWLRAALPSHAPYTSWTLFTFATDEGRRYEVDALVLTPHALFGLELKSWRGKVVDGDVSELVTQSAEFGRRPEDHPLPLLTKKMHALMNRVRRVARVLDPRSPLAQLRYESLVWLSHAEGFDEQSMPPTAAGRAHVVVGRQGLDDALRRAEFPGAHPGLKQNAYAREMQKALLKALSAKEFGLKERPKELTLFDGRTKLGPLVEEGRDFQDHWTKEQVESVPRRRVRSYLLGKADAATVKRIERRAAKEAEHLRRLGEHPDILSLDGFDPSGPLGPALVFRGFEGFALDRFLRQQRDANGRSTLTLEDKLAILQRVAHALDFCHRNEVFHGALSPDAVLVRRLKHKAESRDGRNTVEVKLARFGLAIDEGAPTTSDSRLLTRFGGSAASVFEAPEVARGGRPNAASDLFSLGALAYYLFTEQLPAKSPTELQQRLMRDDGLYVSAATGTFSKRVEDVVFNATYLDPTLRLEATRSPLGFIDQLEDALTDADIPDGETSTPDASPPASLDPLSAGKGDTLGDLRVLGELGTGATAKALKVERIGEESVPLALKIPLSDDHNERIAREGEVLTKLGQLPGLSNITRLVEPPRTLSGRTCLLMEFAGDRTLADEIREKGSISLEFARRWGEELLLALRGLEEAGVHHRDIKPSNIGLTVGAAKQKKRLLLFDFSLAQAKETELGIGTPLYRDPALPARGRWDDAADRWSAAITLYEMVTGSRPQPEPVAKEPNDLAVRVETDRIDPDVREALGTFFRKAFRFGADKRFTTADDMRDAFLRALHKVQESPEEEEERLRSGDVVLTGLGPSDIVSALALPSRANNALDRMGIYTLDELAALKPNRLNGVPGVGLRTARFLVELADRVRAHLERSEEVVESFLPGWHGEVVSLQQAREKVLPAKLVDALVEGAITDSRQLAAAPKSNVRSLLKRARPSSQAGWLKELLAWLQGLVDTERAPDALRAAVAAFVPAPVGKVKPSYERLQVYLGLKAVDGYVPGNANALADRYDVTRQLISIELQASRRLWKLTSQTSDLLRQVYEPLYFRLQSSGGVLPLGTCADLVLSLLPPEPDLTATDARRLAEAMVRIVAEIDLSDLDVTNGVRLLVKSRHAGTLVAVDRAALALADVLGDAADAAVRSEQVLSESAAATLLRQALEKARDDLEPDALANALALPDRALVELAVASASRARLSVRGELYPAGLDPARAVLLSAPALQGELSVDEVKRRIRARYPDAHPLPDRTALDDLLKPLRLSFNNTLGQFVPTDLGHTPIGTEVVIGRTATSKAPAVIRHERATAADPGKNATRTFQEQLERAVAEGAFRVLLWRGLAHANGRSTQERAPDALQVARALAKALPAAHHSMDNLLLEAAAKVALDKKLKGGLAPALKADAAGPDSLQWSRLVDVMRLAADRVIERLQTGTEPIVLTDLGLLARYGLLDLVDQLAKAHRKKTQLPATFIVVPVFSKEGAVVQVGQDVAEWLKADAGTRLVPLRGLLPYELLDVPSPWVERHAPRPMLQSGVA